MSDGGRKQDKLCGAEVQQDVSKARDAKAEATGTSKANLVLSEDDLNAVAGGGPQGHMRKSDNAKAASLLTESRGISETVGL